MEDELKIYKGNAPLMSFSFETYGKSVVVIPEDTSKYTVYMHDNTGTRSGGGTISNINASAGTCQYQSVASDTANAGTATWWIDVDLGEPSPRTFDPQKIPIIDPALV